MPSFVVVAGDMADLEAGNGISARIDLNLHLAPPTSADFLRLGPGPVEEEERAGQELSQRRILPRFGPGIHGVFLDLHQESESSEGSRNRASLSATVVHGSEQASPVEESAQQQSQQRLYHAASSTGDAIGESLAEPAMMRPPMRIRRYPRPASVVRIGGGGSSRRRVDVTAIRSHHQVLDRGSKDKDPVDESKEPVKAAGASDNFECNVCLDLAVEPVVTVCGHLFCWHCLYQWLYVHSDNEECPVCKGSVGEGSIIPIYGRGTSAVARAAAPAAAPEEGREAVPPRPQARRVDSLRQRLEEAGREEWERLNPEEGEREGRRAFWHLNEVLRMRRAIRFLQDSMPSRSRVLRRRMSERREHYRTSFPPPPTAQQSSSDSFEQDLAGRGAAYLQDDYFRELAASRAETEDRVAVIRARLAHLVETIENHRRHAASMVATMHHHDPGVTLLMAQQPATRAGTSSSSRRAGVTTTAAAAVAAAATTVSTSTSTPQARTSSTVVEGPADAGAAAGPSGGNASASDADASEASGDAGDVDPEVLRSRKRRRLI